MSYYVAASKAVGDAACDYLNATEYFPAVGKKAGVLAPESQQTLKWADESTEMLDGRAAIKKIPDDVLDYFGVSAGERSGFLAAFSLEILELDASDFPEPEGEPE